VGKELRGEDSSGDLTNVQYKSVWHYHNESPLHNEYILTKNLIKNKRNRKVNLQNKTICKHRDPKILIRCSKYSQIIIKREMLY
jgi:hypothetical protein